MSVGTPTLCQSRPTTEPLPTFRRVGGENIIYSGKNKKNIIFRHETQKNSCWRLVFCWFSPDDMSVELEVSNKCRYILISR